MVRKAVTKILCMGLSAAMAINPMSMPVMAAQHEDAEVSVSENTAEPDALDEAAGEDAGQSYSLDELMAAGIEALTGEDAKEYIANASDEDIWIWYCSLSDEDRERAEKSEAFGHMMQVAEYETDTGGELLTDGIQEMTYLSYLEKMYGRQRANFNKSGKSTLRYHFPDTSNSAHSSQTLSYSCNGNDTGSSFKVTVALSDPSDWVKNGAYMYYTLAGTKVSTAKDSSDKYSLVLIPLVIHGSKGFTYGKAADEIVTSGGGKLALLSGGSSDAKAYEKLTASADFADNVWLYINLWKNSTMGNYSGLESAVNGVFAMRRSPNSYTMSYNANGGTNAPAPQLCTYAKAGAYPGAPTSPNYTVNYNGNGGNATKASDSVGRTFLGWNTNPSAGSGTTGTYINFTAQHNGNVVNYAIWGGAVGAVSLPGASKSVQISFNGNGGRSDEATKTAACPFTGWGTTPTSGANAGAAGASYTPGGNVTLYAQYQNAGVKAPTAGRTGYQFLGWYNQQAGGTKLADANGTISASGSMTAYAQWKANTYTVDFDANDGSEQKSIAAIYDQPVMLPAAERGGYTFKGWQSGSSVYQAGSTSNLTSDNGGVVKLTAVWEANGNTPYTIIRMVNDTRDGEYRQMRGEEEEAFGQKATEVFYGATDSTAVVPAGDMKGFDTPDIQTVTISADGSASVTFYYNRSQASSGHGGNYYNTVNNYTTNVLDNKDVLEMLAGIRSLSELSFSQIEAVKALIGSNMAITSEAASKLFDLINATGALTDEQKKELLTAIANGYLTDEQKKMLSDAINASNLSASDKQLLLDAINSMSNLTWAQQQKILEALESGSSASYTVKGVEYTTRKNEDGTLTVLLKNMHRQKDVVIPSAVTLAGKTYPITEIAKESFLNNKDIQTLSIGNNVSRIGDRAFEGCKNLKSVQFGAGLREIGDNAFKGCTSLTSVSLPKSLITIGNSVFEGCTKLKTVTLREGLLLIGSKAFYGCTALKKIKIPKSVIKIKSYAFARCSKLKSVSFASGSLLTTLEAGIFANCRALSGIKIPAKVTSIPKKMFFGDKKLKRCTGGAAVTSIGARAFEGCTQLTSYKMMGKVQSVGTKAFFGCKKLSKVTIRTKALTKVGGSAFKGCKKNIRFAIPAEKKSAYTKLLKGKY